MKEQFEKINGYRKLCENEISAMNRIKRLEQSLLAELEIIHMIQRDQKVDQVESTRCSVIAKQKVQEASMWGCRAIALPN